jgi:hypothetical protein
MAIDKGLYSLPEGLDDSQDQGTSIDIVNPDMVTLDDGSVEITLVPDESGPSELASAPFDANLAEYLDEGVLATLASDLVGLVESDINSRKDWADTFVKGLEVLGFKYEDRTDPWLGSAPCWPRR